MSALIETRRGQVQMAFTGDRANIWHRTGKQVPNDLTPAQMCEVAGANWEVTKVPLYRRTDGDIEQVDYFALTRMDDNKILDIVTPNWEPTQNLEAFKFFNEYVAAGDMEMDTAGVLKGGRIVWANARIKDSFEVVPGDVVESYLLFTNPHKFGMCIDIRFTPTRVVCWNTLSMALTGVSSRAFRQTHRTALRAEDAKETLGLASKKMELYKEQAQFLAKIQAKDEDIVSYFTRIFPVQSNDKTKEVKKTVSKNAELAQSMVTEQPGGDFAPGSWWSVFNAATYTVDHLMGRTDEGRFDNALFGQGASKKAAAMKLALEMAGS